MAITITLNTSSIAISETGQTLAVTQGASASLSVATGAQGTNNLTASGTAASGQSFAVNDLVFPDGDTVYLADQTDLTRPALGVVTRIVGTTIFYAPQKAALNKTVTGSTPAGHKTLYLGAAGGVTFTAPTWGSGVLSQVVGHAFEDNGDGTHDCLLDASNLASPT